MPMVDPLPLRLARVAIASAAAVAPSWTASMLSRLAFRPFRAPARPWEREAMESASRFVFEGELGPVPALAWAPQDGGERGTVLMVHGWEGRASQFGPLGMELARRGLRAVAIDVVGHGEAPDGPSTPEHWFDAIGTAMDALGPLQGLVSHSMGAGPSLVALGRGRSAARMVMLAPPSAMGPRMRTAAERLGLHGRAAELFADAAVARIVERGGDPDFARLAGEHAPPALVLHAPDDDLVDLEEGRRMAASARVGRFEAVGLHGHFRLMRDPHTLDRAARWLDGDSEPSSDGTTPTAAAAGVEP